MAGHSLGHGVSVGAVSRKQGCVEKAVLDVRPLNNKCPKIAKIQQGPKFEAMNRFADLLTSGHRLLKIIKTQLIYSESVEHKLRLEV